MERWVATNDLSLVNEGTNPTCVRPQGQSIVDLTCATAGMSRRVDTWAVLPDYIASDHMYIGFTILGTRKESVHRIKKHIRWCHKKMEEETFREALEWSYTGTPPSRELTAEESATEIRSIITNACDAAMPHARRVCRDSYIGGMTTLPGYVEFAFARERNGRDSKPKDAPQH